MSKLFHNNIPPFFEMIVAQQKVNIKQHLVWGIICVLSLLNPPAKKKQVPAGVRFSIHGSSRVSCMS